MVVMSKYVQSVNALDTFSTKEWRYYFCQHDIPNFFFQKCKFWKKSVDDKKSWKNSQYSMLNIELLNST